VDYLEVRDARTLAPLTGDPEGPLRVLVAAWLGKTRLIDNIGVTHPMHRAL
jgi:pantoate--beta-alanine ligase